MAVDYSRLEYCLSAPPLMADDRPPPDFAEEKLDDGWFFHEDALEELIGECSHYQVSK